MTEQRKLILIAGAAGAYLLLKPSKAGAASPLAKLLGKTPTPATLKARQPTSTQLATGTARLPPLSSAQLAQLTPAQRAAYVSAQRGTTLTPAQQLAIARAQQTIPQQVIGGAFDALRAILARPRTPAASQPSKPQQSSGGGSSGGGQGPSSSGGNVPRATDPGRAPGAYDPYSDENNYDAYGNYVGPGAYADDGTYIGGGDPLTAGIFDPNAPTPYDFSGPIDTSSYEPGGSNFEGPLPDESSYEPGGVDFSGPTLPPIDEEGTPDPADDFGLEYDDGDPAARFLAGDDDQVVDLTGADSLGFTGTDDFGLGGGAFDSDWGGGGGGGENPESEAFGDE